MRSRARFAMNKRLLGPSTNHETNASIIELEAHVQGRTGKQLGNFRLIMQNEGLILKGHSLSYYAKQLAQHAVMEVTGIPIVSNEIEVG